MANPEGKGGFQERPQDINKDGRPKNGESLTELLRNYMDNKEIQVTDSDRKILAKQALVQKVFSRAMAGDVNCIKLIWNYLDGMPKQELPPSSEENPIAMAILALKNAQSKTD